MNDETLLALLPAYALEALDTEEAQQVAALLPTNPEAQTVLAEYQAAAVALLMSSPVRQPPSDLEAKLLARARAVNAAPRPTRPRVSKAWWWGAAAAVAAVALLVLGVLLNQPTDDPRSTPTLDRAAIYAAFVANPQSTPFVLVPDQAAEAEGELVLRADTDELMLRLTNLPALEADQAFQLWAIDDETGTFTSIGLYHWYNSGQTTYYVDIRLPQPLGTYQRLGMSLEPLDGSPLVTEPSGPRLLNIPLRLE